MRGGERAAVRPLTAGDDLAAISRIYAESWRTAYRGLIPQSYLDRLRDDAWLPMLRSRPQDSLVLELDGVPVGTACCCAAREEARRGWGEIVSLYLLPACRFRGLGSLLLWSAVERLRTQGLERIYLWVLENNQPARRFYERQGLSPAGDRLSSTFDGETVYEVRYQLLENLRPAR